MYRTVYGLVPWVCCDDGEFDKTHKIDESSLILYNTPIATAQCNFFLGWLALVRIFSVNKSIYCSEDGEFYKTHKIDESSFYFMQHTYSYCTMLFFSRLTLYSLILCK